MDKERKQVTTDDGYSEKELDLAVDKAANDQVKGGSIFDPKNSKKKKPQEK